MNNQSGFCEDNQLLFGHKQVFINLSAGWVESRWMIFCDLLLTMLFVSNWCEKKTKEGIELREGDRTSSLFSVMECPLLDRGDKDDDAVRIETDFSGKRTWTVLWWKRSMLNKEAAQ